MDKVYMCIDLKSFYASVECVERKLDPLTTNLVVADRMRTEKTICLAVSPSLKQYGISGRARLFEVVSKVKDVNNERRKKNNNLKFSSSSYNDIDLKNNRDLELSYIIALPRMNLYMKYSNDIYNVYLKYLAPEDIFVYSVDEVFCDITNYLKYYDKSAEDLVTMIIRDVYETTGITATAGIGTNLFLAKIAMDIVAKHTTPNYAGVRIASLTEETYRKTLWNHKPITDFWRVGSGYKKRLETLGLYTMGDIAEYSIDNEDKLYETFGINAELLIDHAWGYEPCTLKSIKSYTPTVNSLSSGQVLHEPYNYEKTKLILKEMTDLLVLKLVDKRLVTNQIVLTIGYDIENLINPNISKNYHGEIKYDSYGRKIPKHAHGTINLETPTSSTKLILKAVVELYNRIIDPNLLVRRVTITACRVQDELKLEKNIEPRQCNLFTDYEEEKYKKELEVKEQKEEKELQKTLISLKKKFGKNAILKGMNLESGATTIERNKQVGGHRG